MPKADKSEQAEGAAYQSDDAPELNEQRTLNNSESDYATATDNSQLSSSATAQATPTRIDEEEAPVNSAMMAASPFPSTFRNSVSNSDGSLNASNSGVTTNPVATESNREDETLVRRVLAGDTEAFANIVERYKVAVYNLCMRMLHSPEEAEDAAQEIFLRAYNQLATYTPGRRFSTWILSIASHYAIDMLRRRRPTTDLESIEFWKASDKPQPEESAITSETRDEVRDLLTKLPEKYRAVTILRYWQDMPYDEIAETTGLSIATVKTRLFRARELLAKELDKQRRNGNTAQISAPAKGKGKTKRVRGSQNVLP